MSIKGDDVVNKLILLFIFDKMEIALQENTLIDIIRALEDNEQCMTYMDYLETKHALLEDDFITNLSQDASSPAYKITANGRACLADFYTRIPISVRELIVDFVKKNKKNYRIKQEYVSDFYKNKDGTFTVVLKIIETQQPIFELRMIAPTKQIAKTIHSNWVKKAHTTWQNIYESLVD